ncbi:MAG: lysine--tRNA ligase [Deltaproteobacteria bacterium]|nr:lysine--tRNA ligase [Deltaproteobacteria bacterium]
MSEQERKVRAERLEALRKDGVDVFPARVEGFTSLADVRAAHDAKDVETLEAEAPTTAVAGRILAIRSFGKLRFWRLVEGGVSLQVSLRKQEMEADAFALGKQLDVGDFVRVEGPVWRTKTGELTVDARAITVLAKSVRPLPEKWHGLQDHEARFRQRYLDLLANPRAREIALVRSRAVTAMRSFLDGRGFLEVETPVLQTIYGGAAAQPFTTHHKQLGQDLFLRISDELYLKRLVIGGLDRVYEIGRNFRNEGISKKHNPEFSIMECYQAYADYHDMMDLTEAMLKHIAQEAVGSLSLPYQGQTLELDGTWPRKSMRDAILAATGIDIQAAEDVDGLRAAVRERGLDPGDAPTWAVLVDELFSDHVEPDLQQPTFITNHPVALSPLAKESREDPRVAERFEIYMAGMEIGNAFSEQNDPGVQRERFEAQQKAAAEGDAEAHPMDEDFLRALEHGMPPTGGLGLGIGRLAMVLTDTASIREVKLFPHMRPQAPGDGDDGGEGDA